MPKSKQYSLARIRSQIKPFRLIWRPTVGSTNSWAAQARRRKRLFAPSVVLTSHQTSGRGRGTNTFVSPPGVMTATFVLPTNEAIAPNFVPLLAGLAARDAIQRVGKMAVGLKWPNDLWHDDLKLAGLLCERVDGADLIGIGMNLNLDPAEMPSELQSKITSIRLLTSNPIDMDEMVIELTRQLDKRLMHPETSVAAALKEYAFHHVLTDREIRVTDGTTTIEGRCDGIDQHGRLIVTTGTTRQFVLSGSVSLL